MNRNNHHKVTVGVVDPDRDYYDAVLPLGTDAEATFRFYCSGRDVLCRGPADRPALWLISIELPDMTGLDLFAMLRDRLKGAAVCMVGREYRLEDEVGAYRAGAAMYACRPVETAWLRECILKRVHARPPRLGPTSFLQLAARSPPVAAQT